MPPAPRAKAKVLQTETVVVEHPCAEQLRLHAAAAGADLDAPHEELEAPNGQTIQIWGTDPVAYFAEALGEAGHARRAWVEEYAKTGMKPSGPQH